MSNLYSVNEFKTSLMNQLGRFTSISCCLQHYFRFFHILYLNSNKRGFKTYQFAINKMNGSGVYIRRFSYKLRTAKPSLLLRKIQYMQTVVYNYI